MQPFLEKLTPAHLLKSAGQVREHLRTPLYGNAYLLILNQVISAGLGIVYWMVAARFYPADVVGKSSATVSTLVFLSALAELSLKSAMIRYVPRAGKHLGRLVLYTYGMNLLVTGLVTVGFFVLGDYFNFTNSLFSESPNIVPWLVVATMFWTVFFVQDGVLMGMRQALWVLLENSFYNFGKIILLVIGVSGFLTDGIVYSWFIPAPIAVIFVNILIFSRFIPRFLKEAEPPKQPIAARQLVTSVTGDHVGTLLAETSVRMLPLIVINLLGKSQNAYFYQAWLVGTMLYLVGSNMTSSFTVEAALQPKKIAQFSRHTLRQMALLIVPMVLVTLLAAPLLLSLFGKAYAQEGTALLRWLALAAIPYALNVWYLCYARVRSDVKAIILNQGLQCIITLGLSYWWIPIYGITSVGVAWLIAQSVISLVVLVKTLPMLLSRVSSEEQSQVELPAVNGLPAKDLPTDIELRTNFAAKAKGMTAPTYLFLSAHLDDAVLCCGGYIHRLACAGERVIIATVFTGDLPEGESIPWVARINLAAWGLDNAPFAVRCQEDRQAAQILGAQVCHLGLLDAMYRRDRMGKPFYNQVTVGVPVPAEDESTTGAQIQDAFHALIDSCGGMAGLRVFGPLGAGWHVDHLLTRRAAEAVFGAEHIGYYEDFPYAVRPGVNVRPQTEEDQPGLLRKSWQPRNVALSSVEIQARIDASACYVSQIPGLFPSNLERMKEIARRRLPFTSRLLNQPPDARAARQRMETSLRTYIERIGGENFWNYRNEER